MRVRVGLRINGCWVQTDENSTQQSVKSYPAAVPLPSRRGGSKSVTSTSDESGKSTLMTFTSEESTSLWPDQHNISQFVLPLLSLFDLFQKNFFIILMAVAWRNKTSMERENLLFKEFLYQFYSRKMYDFLPGHLIPHNFYFHQKGGNWGGWMGVSSWWWGWVDGGQSIEVGVGGPGVIPWELGGGKIGAIFQANSLISIPIKKKDSENKFELNSK